MKLKPKLSKSPPKPRDTAPGSPQQRIAWPKLLIGSLAAAIVGGLYLVQLDSFVGASATEQAAIQTGKTLSGLGDNPLLAPYKVLVYALLHLPGNDLLHVRLASVIISCVSVWLFFILARRWYGTTNSIWTTMAFAASTWMLQIGRFGAGYSYLMLTILVLLAVTAWVNSTDRHGRAWITYLVTSGLALFTPGGLWFVVAATVVLQKPLLFHRSKAKVIEVVLSGVILAALLAGLAISLVRNTSIIAQWIGLPSQLPAVSAIAKQAAGSITYFVARGPVLPETWLAHTPLLDIASTIFLLFGAIFYARHLRNGRTRLLVSFSLICIVLIAANGAAALNYAVPVVYLILGGGVAYVMHQWNRTFPHNPIARSMSLALMTGLLLAMVGFHAIRYFVAWHDSPDTVRVYSHSEANSSLANDTSNKKSNHLIQ